MNKLIKKLHFSLFTKILLVFLFGLFFYSYSLKISQDIFIKKAAFPKMQQMAVTMARYMVEQVGNPPDTLKAKALTDSLFMELRYQGRNFSWKSSTEMPNFTDIKIPDYIKAPRIKAGFDKGLFVILPVKDGKFLIALQNKREGVYHAAEMILIANFVVSIIIILFMFIQIRWLLKPIKNLDAGVRNLAEGHLEFITKTKRRDELGKLITSFGLMVERIKEMIKARDRLLLDVSHELRSPLTRVKISLEMMQDCPEKFEISSDIREIEIMITEILETERLASPHGSLVFKDIKLKTLIESILHDLKISTHKIGVDNIPDTYIKGDEKRLGILLSNLLTNAVKFSDQKPDSVKMIVQQKNSRLKIIIENRGQSIPDEDLPFIFEPFYRVDKSRAKSGGGYGLGLSLAKRITEEHNGNLTIESIKDGTRAVLELPLNEI